MSEQAPSGSMSCATTIILTFTLCLLACTFASPIPASDAKNEISTCGDVAACRSVSDIVWSCLTTIFACTWIAAHPNIPPQEHTVGRIARRVRILVVALITPELIILWASRQWFAARYIAKQYQRFGWTRTHAFFIQMGGFVLYVDGEPNHVLAPYELGVYLRKGNIDITEAEIQDRSKSDILAKCFVLLQTTWFILQLCARLIGRLPVTGLEVATLAFAILSFATSFFWWNKPLNVDCPVRVHISSTDILHRTADDSLVGKKLTESLRSHDQRATRPSGLLYIWAKVQNFGQSVLVSPFSRLILRDSCEDRTVYLSTIDEIPNADTGGEVSVSTYHSSSLAPNETFIVYTIASGIAAVFGGIHCAAWFSHFPSRTEQLLWRVSAVVMTSVPPVYSFLLYATLHWATKISSRQTSKVLIYLFFYSASLAAILYVIARLTLLVQMFVLLRSPPPGIYNTVHWTAFIPHI